MAHEVPRIAVLGSTGSIGRQTLDVVRALPGRFEVIGLAAGTNATLLLEQAGEFHPRFITLGDAGALSGELDALVRERNSRVVTLEEMATLPDADIIVMATSGSVGIRAAIAAARAGKNIALANKESLVAAGELMMREATQHGASILPVDSEHSAIWQCLQGEQQPRRILLTASGGPFRTYTAEQMRDITVEQALAHPSWSMGKKVTIDSATLMNKGLEIIEAHRLFDVPIDDIEVIIHPQSIIHSMVEFGDGSVKAQLSYPDMRLPIQYALTYPDHVENAGLPRIDWAAVGPLAFEMPDTGRFPCLKLAIEAGKQGGTYPAVLCAADEVAVDLFLSGRIGFTDIARLVAGALERHNSVANPGLDEIMEADEWSRQAVNRLSAEITAWH